MRRLSGWARLWIILAAGIWGYGGWWIASNARSPPVIPAAHSECSAYYEPFYLDERDEPRFACNNPLAGSLDAFNARMRGDEAAALESEQQAEQLRNECIARVEAEEADRLRQYRTCLTAASTPERVERRRQAHESRMLNYVGAILGQIVVVALSPLVVGAVLWLVWIIARWVWRGFRPQSNEDK